MKVIANETVRNLIVKDDKDLPILNIYKGTEYEVDWHDEVTEDDCKEMLKN